MAITITEIITVDEYIGIYPQDANVEEDLIQSAINRATITLDAICGGMIAQVWSVTDPTSTLYRTEEEKNYIKQAHAIQAQYNVSRNLDMSAGTESYTSGSNNYNETRPRADMVADEIIYQLLAKGRVYNPNITSNTTIKNVGGVQDGFYDPSYDPGDEYVTYNVGDLRYVKANNTDGANKYAKWDENGNIVADEIKLSPTGTSSAIANFITLGGVEWALGGSGGSAVWGQIQGTLNDQTDLNDALTSLERYCDSLDATKAGLDYVNEQLATKVNKITTAGFGAYGHNGSTETEWIIDANPTAQTLAYRTTNGVLRVGTPTEDNHATTKQYVDTALANKQDIINKYADSASVANNTLTINFSNGDTTSFTPTSQPGGITDVQVTDTQGTASVVTEGVATIDLTGYATTTNVNEQLATKQDKLAYIELYGTTGTLTDEQKAILVQSPNNYIWYAPTSTDTDGNILQCIYYSPNEMAQYSITFDTGYINSISVDLTTGVWTFTSNRVAKYSELPQTYISTTYSELKTLRDNSQLKAGCWYRITDYVATTTQTNTQATTNQYDIIVLATSTNTLSEEARAIQHSGDTYFANSNLNAWKVWYCLDNDTNRFSWADSTNGKGVVYHLIDEFDNDIWYDFKCIKVTNSNAPVSGNYYYLFDNSGVDASLNTSSAITCFSNKFGKYISEYFIHSIGCNIFCMAYRIYLNTIGTGFYNNTIGSSSVRSDFVKNIIGFSFASNTIGTGFNNNTISNNFASNTIGSQFHGNIIGFAFASNTIGKRFDTNTIGSEFDGNTIGNDFTYNTIGNYFSDNVMSSSSTIPENCIFPSGVDGLITASTTFTRVNKVTFYIGSDDTLKTLD